MEEEVDVAGVVDVDGAAAAGEDVREVPVAFIVSPAIGTLST